jgi:hypothetical protein
MGTIQKLGRSQTNEMISRANSTGFYAITSLYTPLGLYTIPSLYTPFGSYNLPGLHVISRGTARAGSSSVA